MQTDIKFVDFVKYCLLCINEKLDGNEEPCNECLTNPINIDSHKPVNFVENVK